MSGEIKIHFDNGPLEAGRPFERTLAAQSQSINENTPGPEPLRLDKEQLVIQALITSRKSGRDVGEQFRQLREVSKKNDGSSISH